jgi:hypothetical protein
MADPVRCVDCLHFTLKNKSGYGKSEMAGHGCGYCAWEKNPGSYYPALYVRTDCSKFTPGKPEKILERLEFLKDRGKTWK